MSALDSRAIVQIVERDSRSLRRRDSICAPALSSYLQVQLTELPRARYKGFVLTIHSTMLATRTWPEGTPISAITLDARVSINGTFRFKKDASSVMQTRTNPCQKLQDLWMTYHRMTDN